MEAVGESTEQNEMKKCEFIADPKERMLKWKRRSESLMKKAWELSTLCDTPTCIVISPPTDPEHHGSSTPDSKFAMWPNNHDSLRRMIHLYKADQFNKSNIISSSPTPTTVKARATKKVKVDNNNHVSVSCGGVLTASGNSNRNVVEEAGKSELLKAVNARMDQIETRIVQIDARKRKSPPDYVDQDDAVVNAGDDNTNTKAIVDAAANGERKGNVDDVIAFDFLDVTDDNNATEKQNNISNVSSVAADIHLGGGALVEGGKTQNSINANNNNLDEDTGHYFSDLLQDDDGKFQNIFEQINGKDSYINTRSSFYHDEFLCNNNNINDAASNCFPTNPTTLTPWENVILNSGSRL